MGSFTDHWENEILDHLFGKGSYTPPTIHVGLSTADPGDDGTGLSEPSGNGYGRVKMIRGHDLYGINAGLLLKQLPEIAVRSTSRIAAFPILFCIPFFDNFLAYIASAGNAVEVLSPGIVFEEFAYAVSDAVLRPIHIICREPVRVADRGDLHIGICQ